MKKENRIVVQEFGKKIFIPVSLKSEGLVNKQLHPKYESEFITIIGKVKNLERAIAFLKDENFNPRWLLGGRIKRHKIERRNLPNFLSLVKLISGDRLLSLRQMLQNLREVFGDGSEVYFIFKDYTKVGIVEQEVTNNNLDYLAKIIHHNLRTIYDVFKDVEDITALDKESYHKLKNAAKEKIFEAALELAKNDSKRLAEGLSDVSNEELKEIYLR